MSEEKSLLDYWELKNVKDTVVNDTMKKVANSLKSKNMPIEFIMEITGLTTDEIEEL